MNFYKAASAVLDKLDAKQGSIQSNLSLVQEKDRKRTAALIIETLKYKSALVEILAATPLLKQEKRHIPSLNFALVLVHDLLFSKGGIQMGDGPVKQAILRHQTRLRAELVKIKMKRGVKDNTELAHQRDTRADQIPRYARVNTNVWNLEDALRHFQTSGFTLTTDTSTVLDPKSFYVDQHVPNLLAFHSSQTFQNSLLIADGRIILQDKASCFPALVLAPTEGARVVDATAAPGNKTSHLSALMNNKGQIIAFERDRRRYATLQTMLKKARSENVTHKNQDFLSTEPEDRLFEGVTHILLDPSCSGSGIVNRMDYLVEAGKEENAVEEERLQKLSSFQMKMIKHAMKIPSAQRIVYSTCSVHKEENECVVRDALLSDEAKEAPFVLAPKSEVMPGWDRRGQSEGLDISTEMASSMIRCVPGQDHTNGFFVACFVKAGPHNTAAVQSQPTRKRKLGDNEPLSVTDDAPREQKRRKKKKKKEMGIAP